MSVINEQSRELDQEVDQLFICLYTNSKNETKVQTLRNARKRAAGNMYYVQGWSEAHNGVITLRADRVVAVFDTVEQAHQSLDANLSQIHSASIHDLPEGKPFSTSDSSTFDICFSGFNANNRKELEAYAIDVGMTVRTRVTNSLNVLVAGKRVGPAKLMQAIALGAFVIDEEQFLLLAQNGELPDELPESLNAPLSQSQARDRKDLDKLEKLQQDLATSFSGLKTLPRRENPIAIFEDNRAIGWKFHVPSVFREALDIRLTPFTVHGKTTDTWTQGHAYSFKVGDSIGSHSTKDWKAFLNQENATLLQVKFATPAGFDENKKFEGPVTGGFYSSKSTNHPTQIDGLTLTTSSYTYDPGVLTISVYKPNSDKTKVELFDTLVLDQVEFVTLLQFGYYWQKPESKEDETTLKKIQLVP